MKEYEFEAKHFQYSTYLQQKQLFTIHEHALQGTAGLSHHKIWKTSNKRHCLVIAIKLYSHCGAY